MENRIFIGIDPGIKGGIAVIYEDNYFVKPTPNTVAEMAQEIISLKDIGPNTQKFAIIEAVHSMPGNSGRSMFTFGMNYGQWIGILATLKIPYIQVTPHKWQKWYGSMPKVRKDRKNHLKHLAQQRFPNAKINLTTADAMLICNYLKETNKE